MPFAEHLIATTRDLDRTLTRPEHARWLFAQLRVALGAVLSFVLMPDHLHLVARAGLTSCLTKVLAAFTKRTGIRFDVRPPEIANTAATAGRMMRYGFYNPVRAELVEDPWQWPWSTLRDLGGATYPCWTPIDVVASTLGFTVRSMMRGLTTVANRMAPTPHPARVEIASVDAIRGAVESVLRAPPRETSVRSLGRRLIVQTCDELGGPSAARLAIDLECDERSVRRLRQPRHPALPAVLLCLADPRLRDDGIRSALTPVHR